MRVQVGAAWVAPTLSPCQAGGRAIATLRGATAPQPQRLMLRGAAQLASFDRHQMRHASCVRVDMTNPRPLLERDIERQLRSGPIVNAPPIIVAANPDTATLLDSIDLHGETCPAWDTAKRVGSAGTLAQEATIKLFAEHVPRDKPATELAVSSQVVVPRGIRLSVHDGSATLEGQITWNYRRDAERAIQHLSNAIGLSAHNLPCCVSHVQGNVEAALMWLPMDASKE